MFVILFGCAPTLSAEEPVTQLAKPDKLLFSDDFSRSEPGEAWSGSVRSFRIEDGAFIVTQRSDATHPAVTRVTPEFKDGIITFRFRFDGAPRFGVVFNDKTYEQSHAGHICRVSVSPTQISIGDDREGAMKHGIYELRQDPARRAEYDALVESRQAKAAVKIEKDRWYSMTIEIVDDEMAVSLDDRPVVQFKSPGIGHAIKNHWGFTVSGQSMAFDDLKLWSVAKH